MGLENFTTGKIGGGWGGGTGENAGKAGLHEHDRGEKLGKIWGTKSRLHWVRLKWVRSPEAWGFGRLSSEEFLVPWSRPAHPILETKTAQQNAISMANMSK